MGWACETELQSRRPLASSMPDSQPSHAGPTQGGHPRRRRTLSKRTWLFTFSFSFPFDHFCDA